MFTTELLDFLADLKTNNTRDWFQGQKKRYEAVYKGPAKAFGEVMAAELQRETGLAHKAKLFRVNRDLRFSKDKTPYNTHMHMSLIPETGQAIPPAWMVGIAPDYMSFGVGCFAFDKPMLAGFRDLVDGTKGEGVEALLARLDGVRLSEPDLKRVPAPFDKDHPRGTLLRRKGLAAWVDVDDPRAALTEDLPKHAMQAFRRLRPVFDLLAGL